MPGDNINFDNLCSSIREAINTDNPDSLRALDLRQVVKQSCPIERSRLIELSDQGLGTLLSWLLSGDEYTMSSVVYVLMFFLDFQAVALVLEKLLDLEPKYFPFNLSFNSSEHEFNLQHKSFPHGIGFSYYGRENADIERILGLLEKHYARLCARCLRPPYRSLRPVPER